MQQCCKYNGTDMGQWTILGTWSHQVCDEKKFFFW
jgi:hypothetical protein